MFGLRNSTVLSGYIAVLIIIGSVISQDAPTSNRRIGKNRTHIHHHRKHATEGRRENKTGLLALGDGDGKVVEPTDKDKYYEDEDDDKYYVYDDEEAGPSNETQEEDDKFIETSSGGIVFDHVDFVLLRLKHISMRTSSNISELLALQRKEFKVNTHYQQGWATAEKLFNDSKREKIFNNTSPDSLAQTVPPEYHIAIIAYTLGEPSMYYEFNKDTREVCSGTDIDKYQWKSYFKLLQLAVETLGSRIDRWRDSRRFLYRGASGEYTLKEGQVLAFQHYISTSAALISAENFAGKTLFEFEGFYNGTAMAIWDHSIYEHEEEVLFSPLQVFRVDSIHVGTHYTRYVLVKHELPSEPCSREPSTDFDKAELKRNELNEYSSSNSISGRTFLVPLLVSISVMFVHL